MKKIALLICIIVVGSCKNSKENSQGESFTNQVNQVTENLVDDSDKLLFFNDSVSPIKPTFTQFSSGSVKPKGWILKMMQSDLENGIVGALDELYPGINADDLYNSARRGGMEDIPEMGDLVLTGEAWETSIMWWNAETIGNWWDGFIRHAFLTNNRAAISQSKKIIDNLLDSQDGDGYIGIYKPNLRYQHEGSNGELWAQTTAFRAMLAYYEFTNNQKVLDAVTKAMSLTMKKYGTKGRNPFALKNEFGGATHGLMLTDVCETLFRITNDVVYQNYATYLYQAFSTFSINRAFNDMRFPFLQNKDSLFESHAVHTYEHIRAITNAYYNTGYQDLAQAYENMCFKLAPCMLPSGAGHGNEWIAKMRANPDFTATEYCAMLELRNSFGSLLQKTGDVEFADKAEKLTYNAMLGTRNLEGTAITYGKRDNCYVLDGKHHQDGKTFADPRFKYSPTHAEPAVCCAPNYGRNFTYFLEQMWMKSDDGIVALMFGPSELTTEMDGSKLVIEQLTNYPLSDAITFKFKTNQPKKFTFYVRKPNWSSGIVDESMFDGFKNGLYFVTKEWKNGDEISVTFKNETQVKQAANDEYYVQRGPLVYAYEIPHNEKTIKNYSNKNFKDYYCFPISDDFQNLKMPENSEYRLISKGNADSFYTNEFYLETEFFDESSSKTKKIKLVPIGKTILRKVTFPLKNEQ